MTPERHRRVGELYREALDVPLERRSAFLSNACQGDLTLVRDVESLLAYDAQSGAMIDGSALEVLGRAMGVEQSQSWVGRQIGHYLVLSLLGRGGMGEVYRARDSRLGRDVAIKALPLVYSADPARLHRFEQESRAAGQLNHPNILTVYDIGVHDGAPFIVTELLEGEDLRHHLRGGALPPRRALDYARQIARGLAATHAKGILHRDLKPENLFVTRDGRVKILDFGLAKLAVSPPAGDTSSGRRLETSADVVAGTVDYMSPEQLRGESVDQRTDLFAFGVVLYEMLTGLRPFNRGSRPEVMTAILTEEPPDLDEPGGAVTPPVARIVKRCLEKDPGQRFQSASDLGFALDVLSPDSGASFDGHTGSMAPIRVAGIPERGRRVWRTVVLASLIGAAIGGIVVWKTLAVPKPARGPVARLQLPVETGAVGGGDLALSRDGAYVAYATRRAGARTLYLRNLAAPDVAPVEIVGGEGPFFSPDSRWLGFFADGKMKKIPVHGGVPITLAEAPSPRGADWGEHGSIVFAPIARSGLFVVPADGGVAEVLTAPDAKRLETAHVRPRWLPGRNTVVYVALGETESNSALVVLSREDRQRRVLLEGAGIPAYVPTGHLAYVSAGRLMAVPFDLERLETAGTPIPVVEDVATYALSEGGTLIYAPRLASGTARALVWVDRKGQAAPLGAPLRPYSRPRLSPDARRVAVTIASGSEHNIWIYDSVREALTRLTFEGRNSWPVWSPDGKQVIYASNRAGTTWDIYRRWADGTGAEDPLLIKPLLQIPHTLSKDGRLLSVTEIGTSSVHTRLFSMTDRSLGLNLTTNAWTPSLSPDGRWVTYTSSETGRYEVHVRPTSGAAGKWQISTEGGVEPLWSASGSELFYRDGDKMYAVDVMTGAGFEYGKPRELFETLYLLGEVKDDHRQYDVTPDGQRFLMLKDETEPDAGQLNVVINWFDDLERVMSRGK